jgi:hypothetical protein
LPRFSFRSRDYISVYIVKCGNKKECRV